MKINPIKLHNKNTQTCITITAWPAYSADGVFIGWYSWEPPSDIYHDKGIWLPEHAWKGVK